MTDPLSTTISGILWPYLKGLGFKKSTSRKFAREKNDVIQQIWVDANGVSKSKSTRIVLCCTFPYAESKGYMDPHGFIINNGKHYNLSTESAQATMTQIVASLDESELATLDRLSDAEQMLAALEPLTTRNWRAIFSELQRRWLSGDAELLEIAEQNRRRLKL